MDTALYTEWLLAQGLGKSTIYNYRQKVLKAGRIAGEQGWDLRHPTASQLSWIAGHFPDTNPSRGVLRSALTHYYRMLDTDAPLGAIIVPDPPPGQYRGLEDDDADRLEAVARGRWPEGGAVMIGLYLGLRRAEMASLRWDNFDQELVKVQIFGKGKRTRFLPVHDALRVELAPYMAHGYLFPGETRPHVHTGTIRNWIGLLAEKADLTITNPHALRYVAANRLYAECRDIFMVQRFLGHADATTTARYLTKADEEAMREAVGRINYRRAQNRAA